MPRQIGRVLLAATFVVALPVVGAPADDRLAGATTAYGVGQQSCGNWNLSHTAPVDPLGLAQTSWVQGFVTGVGFFAPIRKTDKKEIEAYMTTYCRANPSNTIFDGATQMAKDWRAPQ